MQTGLSIVVTIQLKFGDGMLGILTIAEHLKYSNDSDSGWYEHATDMFKLLK